MTELEDLKMSETIMAFSYWENWSHYKLMAQSIGGQHPYVKKIEREVNQIREEWNAISIRIKELENESPMDKKRSG